MECKLLLLPLKILIIIYLLVFVLFSYSIKLLLNFTNYYLQINHIGIRRFIFIFLELKSEDLYFNSVSDTLGL